jgi:predicted small lipoprotein YifL
MRLALSLLLLASLAGCGQSGALVLPDKAKPPPSIPAPLGQPAPGDDQQKRK